MKKTAIVSCYFQHNYGSMLQAYATQMALDKLGYENETVDISGFNGEIKKAKLLYFTKALNCLRFVQKNLMHSAVNSLGSLQNIVRKQSLEINVKIIIRMYL